MIYLLWPTVRPEMMKNVHQFWLDQADHPKNVRTHIAVNTQEQADVLKDNFDVVWICGNKIKGVAPASYVLSSKLEANPTDIVILASDDFYPPKHWDTYIQNQFKKWEGTILVNDGYQTGGCVTIPIMTFKCLKALNKIIYHPEYRHLWSDNELYVNLRKLKLLKNLRKSSPLFEHKHPDNKKRKFDKIDHTVRVQSKGAGKLYKERTKRPIHKRLKVGPVWQKYVANAKRA